MLTLSDALVAFAAVVSFAYASRLLWANDLDKAIASRLARHHKPLALILLASLLLSMLSTNDGSLFVIAPLARDLAEAGYSASLATVIVSFAANAGSTITPFGNPQNIIIFEVYKPSLQSWLSISSLACIAILAPALVYSLNIEACRIQASIRELRLKPVNFYGALLVAATGYATIAGCRELLYALAVLSASSVYVSPLLSVTISKPDERLLALLAIFIFAPTVAHATIPLTGYPLLDYWLLLGVSQIASNVPAAVFAVNHGVDWRLALIALNVGGAGTIVASLTNLIAVVLVGANIRDYHKISLKAAAFSWLLGALLVYTLL